MLVLIRHINLLLKTLPSYIENNCAIPFAASKVQKKKKKKVSIISLDIKKEINQKKKTYKNK
jgi:hypothetical protein